MLFFNPSKLSTVFSVILKPYINTIRISSKHCINLFIQITRALLLVNLFNINLT